MSALRYSVQTHAAGKWREVFAESSRGYCLGYLARVRDGTKPCAAWRIVDTKTDRVVDSIDAREDLSIGIIAGMPAAETYERAADRALEYARWIRDRERSHG